MIDLTKPIRLKDTELKAVVVDVDAAHDRVWVAHERHGGEWFTLCYAINRCDDEFENIPDSKRVTAWLSVWERNDGSLYVGNWFKSRADAMVGRDFDVSGWYAAIKIDREIERGHVDEG